MARLTRDFFMGNTVNIAQNLLGMYLVRRIHGESLVCRILETEAYVGRIDKACHAYQYHRTPRTEVMFGEPGHAYIYLIYGMHHCLNFVTEPAGEPSAVLLRNVEPIAGVSTISQLRFACLPTELSNYQQKNFMNGPGKLCKGLSLTTEENTMDLTGDTLFICTSPSDAGIHKISPPLYRKIYSGPRIGIDYAEEAREFPWRFWIDP